jgi:hypothetical protein
LDHLASGLKMRYVDRARQVRFLPLAERVFDDAGAVFFIYAGGEEPFAGRSAGSR